MGMPCMCVCICLHVCACACVAVLFSGWQSDSIQMPLIQHIENMWLKHKQGFLWWCITTPILVYEMFSSSECIIQTVESLFWPWPLIQYFHWTFSLMTISHKIKSGCKRISSEYVYLKLSHFNYVGPCCDLDHEDSTKTLCMICCLKMMHCHTRFGCHRLNISEDIDKARQKDRWIDRVIPVYLLSPALLQGYDE